ncbi:MAG: UDP-N-acetylmuramate dehydrogenase [Chloroflexota bacterium]|nr:UDP-N-acetylmuramate dehydrogenase [Chloroflexota bacterium]
MAQAATERIIEEGTSIRSLLQEELGRENVFQGEPLSKHTSFRVGGLADWLLRANDADALVRAIHIAQRFRQPFRIIGGGSNILVSDRGIEGIVILNRANNYELIERAGGFLLVAESGVQLPRVAGELAKRGASGMEWGVGVPGTVGGAVVQNAGAWGSETKDRLLSIEYLVPHTGETKRIQADKLGLRYRGSNILDQPPEQRPVILRAWFRLERDDPAAIAARNMRYREERTATQPRAASGGSTFRNPPGDYAGRLLDAAGLKGYHTGGARFSEKHANFIVNEGSATATDIRHLIEHAQEVVRQRFGIQLETEVEFVGEWERDER